MSTTSSETAAGEDESGPDAANHQQPPRSTARLILATLALLLSLGAVLYSAWESFGPTPPRPRRQFEQTDLSQ